MEERLRNTKQMLQILASTCNSTIIETYVDIIRVSHGFEYFQSLGFIDIMFES